MCIRDRIGNVLRVPAGSPDLEVGGQHLDRLVAQHPAGADDEDPRCAQAMPSTILATTSETFSARYSAGGVHVPTDRTARSIAGRMRSASTPASRLLPHSMVSGRSVTSRIVTVGTPKMQHSSCTVPLSESTQNASFSRRTKSNRPSGGTNLILPAWTPNCCILSAVRGCSDASIGMSYFSMVSLRAPTSEARRAGSSTVSALSLIHISEPTRLGMISYAVFCLK